MPPDPPSGLGLRPSFCRLYASWLLPRNIPDIVLCSKIYNCSWKIASLEWSSDQDSSRSICGALQACFGFHEIFTIVQGNLFVLTSLKAQLRLREEWLCKGNWLTDAPTSIDHEAPNRWKKKKCGQGLRIVGRRRGLESPRRHFRPQKLDIKTLNSVTVHL